MDVQETAKSTANVSESHPQIDSNGQFSGDSDQSLSNGGVGNNALGVTSMKNFGRHFQEIVSEESFEPRRVSPRLKNIPENKRPYYGTSRMVSVHHPEDKFSEEKLNAEHSKRISLADVSGKKGDKDCESDLDHSKQNCMPSGSRENTGDKGSKSDAAISNAATSSTRCEGGNNGNIDSKVGVKKWLDGGNSSPVADGKGAYARVKETLRIYNKYYLHFVQEKENRCKKMDANVQKSAGLKRKKKGAFEEGVKRSSKRPDLRATSKMLETNTILYSKKRFGHLPGIDVGHQFYSRAEMVAIGFHSHWLYGIDYVAKSYCKLVMSLWELWSIKLLMKLILQKEYKGHTLPLAVAIVLSGQYEDDQDNLEEVVHTGQGGNDLLGNKHQVKNQEMSRGNLALKNNMEQSVCVRVIRGHKSDCSFGKVYTYDGLYKVVECWPDKGVSGFVVYKYCLRRLEGQSELATKQVYFTQGRASKVPSRLLGLVCEDICGSQEDICIPATNLVDDTPVAPMGKFTY